MLAAASIRRQIEAALADRIPSALTPTPSIVRPVAPTGIDSLDDILQGGFPLGSITEITGPECSGRTSVALAFLAQVTQTAKVASWIDVSDTLDPVSAAAAGVALERLLWIRCGMAPVNHSFVEPCSVDLPASYFTAKPITKGLHGGGHGPHPRHEVKGLSNAVSNLLRPTFNSAHIHPRCAEPQRQTRQNKKPLQSSPAAAIMPNTAVRQAPKTPWSRLDQALRATDLLLQAGGFSAIVLDLASVAPEHALRVPIATWFRYRAAAEKSQATILLLNQQSCAKSSAGLVLNLAVSEPLRDLPSVFTGCIHRVELARQRFAANQPPNQFPANVVPLRKPPQPANAAMWQTHTVWVDAVWKKGAVHG